MSLSHGSEDRLSIALELAHPAVVARLTHDAARGGRHCFRATPCMCAELVSEKGGRAPVVPVVAKLVEPSRRVVLEGERPAAAKDANAPTGHTRGATRAL